MTTLRTPVDTDALRQWADYQPLRNDLAVTVPLSIWQQIVADLVASAEELDLCYLERRGTS